MWIYHGLRLLPPTPTPPSQWLTIPLVAETPLYDDAGVEFARDLCITEGFYTLITVYIAWRVFLGWIVRQ